MRLLSHVQPPPIPPPTPFWGLGFRFEVIGYEFYNTYQSIKEIWLIGLYLAWPFYFVSQAFFAARDLSWDADQLIKTIQGWVDGLITGDTFRQLYYNLGYHFWQLLNNPVGWLVERFYETSYDLFSIYINARAWLEAKVILSFPFIADIRINPYGWIRNLLQITYGYAADFLNDPDGFLRSRLQWIYPFIASLSITPVGYITSLIISRYPFFGQFFDDMPGEIARALGNRYPDLLLLFSNPRFWFEEKLLELLGIRVDPDLGFLLSVLKGIVYAIIGTQGARLSRVTSLLCDVILKFV